MPKVCQDRLPEGEKRVTILNQSKNGARTVRMPTYVYGCDSCGHRFEMFQKFQDASLTECPACGAPIRRIFQPTGIVFKGSGWYSTDSRLSQQKSVPAEDGSTPSSAGDDKVKTGATGDEAVKAATKVVAKPEVSASAKSAEG